MRPPFNNSCRPQHRPQRQQHQNNGYNGYQNPAESNQLGMMNPQIMNNPMMGHMNNSIRMPNMPPPRPPPINPQFFNNMPQQQLNQFGLPNHINQLLPSLLGNLQFAVANNNNNLMGHSLPFAQPNFFQPSLEPSAFTSLPYPPSVPNSYQNHQVQPPGFSEPRPQGQSNNTNGSGFRGNDFRPKQHKFKGPGQGFQRSQPRQADNAKKRFGFNKNHMGKGKYNKIATGPDGSDEIAKEKKRSFAAIYTPVEIKKWREARRKNFPTKLNVEMKLKKNVSDDEEARLRRQQLREVLAKQAELGLEVAEVPPHLLPNRDEQTNGDRQTRHNKRRHGERNKFSKKPRFKNENSSQESNMTTKKPSLLEKLLSADIKKEKMQLLQVFRFMVMNSFFKNPEQALKLPLVMVEETGCEHPREEEDTATEALCGDNGDDTVDVDEDDDEDDVSGDDNSCDEADD